MKIYTLFYKDTGLYNRSIFVLPNDAAAIKAMKLNLMDSRAEQFRNEVKLGNVELLALNEFSEEDGIGKELGPQIIYNLKTLLKEIENDNGGNTTPVQ